MNDDGVDVGDEEEGEIVSCPLDVACEASLILRQVLRGPNIMLGYIGNPEASADTVRDGWYVHFDGFCLRQLKD